MDGGGTPPPADRRVRRVRLERLALAPVRAAARSSRGILEEETESLVDAICAGPLPEAFARSLVEQHVIERVASEVVRVAAPEGLDAERLEQLVASVLRNPAFGGVDGADAARLAEQYAVQIVRSAAFRHALGEVLSSPEIRRALTSQSRGFAGDVADAAATGAGRFDDGVEARLHRRSPPQQSLFGGLATRGVALVLDAALVQVLYLALAGSIALVVGLTGALDPGWLAGTLAGIAWFVVAGVYFALFWSGPGQTPGMRVMRVRVETGSTTPPSVPRSLVRFVGLILAIVPLFAGFLPVLFDRRRRALQDFLAGTVVVRDLPPE